MKDLQFNDDDGYFYYGDYSSLIDSFEYEVLVEVHDRDYQGDSRYLFRNGDQYGYLNFGWGSCSGCDALQACDNKEQVIALRDSLHEGIKWETKEEMLKFFKDRDWEGQYSWHAEENKEFVEQVINLLSHE